MRLWRRLVLAVLCTLVILIVIVVVRFEAENKLNNADDDQDGNSAKTQTKGPRLYHVPILENVGLKSGPIDPCNQIDVDQLLMCLFNRYSGGVRPPTIRAMPIVVLGSDRPQYLSRVISSLCACFGMSKEHNLVIISLDFVRNDTLEAVTSIISQKNCPFRVKILFNEARKPSDRRRGPQQLMLHWWWLMEQLFEQNYILPSDYDGDVMFLEEDQQVSKDAYVVSSFMVEMKNRLASKHDMWGTALSHYAVPGMPNETDPYEFRFLQHSFPPSPNMGYTFNRTIWYRIREHRAHYWESGFPFIDWDNIVGHLMQRCLIPTVVILPTVTRIRHIGEQGIIPLHIFHERHYNETEMSNLTEFDTKKFSWRPGESPADILPCVDGAIPGNKCWRCGECKTCKLDKNKMKRVP